MKTGHKHAKLAQQFWAEMEHDAEAWRNWEFLGAVSEKWIRFNGSCFDFLDHLEYRRKTETVTINGVELVAPVREALGFGQSYYAICFAYDGGCSLHVWSGDNADLCFLESNVVFLTAADANAYAQALINLGRKNED